MRVGRPPRAAPKHRMDAPIGPAGHLRNRSNLTFRHVTGWPRGGDVIAVLTRSPTSSPRPTVGAGGRGDGSRRCGTCAAAASTGTLPVPARSCRDGDSVRRSATRRAWSARLAASSAVISDSRNRRCPPGVRMDPIHPLDAHRVTVLGFTRNNAATWCGVSSRSVFSSVTLPTFAGPPDVVPQRTCRPILHQRVPDPQSQPRSDDHLHRTGTHPRSSLRRVACRGTIRGCAGWWVDHPRASPWRRVRRRSRRVELLAGASYHRW